MTIESKQFCLLSWSSAGQGIFVDTHIASKIESIELVRRTVVGWVGHFITLNHAEHGVTTIGPGQHLVCDDMATTCN